MRACVSHVCIFIIFHPLLFRLWILPFLLTIIASKFSCCDFSVIVISPLKFTDDYWLAGWWISPSFFSNCFFTYMRSITEARYFSSNERKGWREIAKNQPNRTCLTTKNRTECWRFTKIRGNTVFLHNR